MVSFVLDATALIASPPRSREEDAALRRRIGGKAAHLASVGRAGAPVPVWTVVTTDAFERFLIRSELGPRIEALLAECSGSTDAPSLAGASSTIRDWICAANIDAELAEALRAAYRRNFPTRPPIAVRSSGVDEDRAEDSFAGQHESVLGVQGEVELLRQVRRVWASAFTERVLAYRRERGIGWERIRIAVVLQEMIASRVSGVAFTANPVSGDLGECVVSVVHGLGEGLVGLGFDADTFTVDKSERTVSADIVTKDERLDMDGEGGVVRSSVTESLRDGPSLDEGQIQEVVERALALERHFRWPQDIEFAFDGDGLWILQSRPITTVDRPGPAAGHRAIWDNSNITESYAGVTSPLTFSFIRRAYTIVYHCFAEVMGITPDVVRQNDKVFSNMLGLFRGRVYYNLLNWYRLIRLFPGFGANQRFMESMMGVSEPTELAEEAERLGFWRGKVIENAKLVRLALRMSWRFVRIRSTVTRFQEHFQRHYRRWEALDFETMSPGDLVEVYREMEEELLWEWKAPIINDFYVMIFYGLLKKVCRDWMGDTEATLQNDLICGEGDIESTEPTRLLLQLAWAIRANEAQAKFFRESSVETLTQAIPREPEWAAVARQVEDYLDRYGFRCMNELKLEEPSLREEPRFIFQMLKNYVSIDASRLPDPNTQLEKERAIRAAAEAKVAAKLSGVRRMVFGRILRNARQGVKNRENLRFARTRIYGRVRELFLAMGNHFAGAGLIAERDDVFFLTVDEIWSFVVGTAVTTDLAGLVRLRREEFARYRNDEVEPPDDRFETYGMAYHHNDFRSRAKPPLSPDEGETAGDLRGIGCGPGRVEGVVRVVSSPADDLSLDGEILVAARTDPGWVPLYPSISGLLVERGSILSHSAIVAREMGIPTIVGIPGLCRTLKSGDRVVMDGSAGTVDLLAE